MFLLFDQANKQAEGGDFVFSEVSNNRRLKLPMRITRVHREIVVERDPVTRELLSAILSYPGVPKRWGEPDLMAPQDVIIPIEMRFGNQTLRLFSTITTLGSPHDITLQELRIESFHPADEATADVARSIAAHA